MRRLRIGVVHPQPRAGGGSEKKTLWILETLKDSADMAFIAMGTIDLDELNRAYGTHITKREIALVEIPIPPLMKRRFDALRSYRLGRYIRKNASAFDILISAYNVMDFGVRGIQFISDFSFDDRLRRKLLPKRKSVKNLVYMSSPFRNAYLLLGKILAGGSQDGWKKNLSVANSYWGANIFDEAYGTKCRVIYPPVTEDFPSIPWEVRGNGFVALGRIVPEKQIDRIIRVLERVKMDGWDVHLHIVGASEDTSYAEEIRRLVNKNKNWIFWGGPAYGKEKNHLLASHRFGIHACENELVGNAVIEMIKAGCLVWVPKNGGPAEIVNHPDLIYRDEKEAVSKIEAILKNDSLCLALRSHLRNQAEQFSLEKFQNQIKKLIEQFMSRHGEIQA